MDDYIVLLGYHFGTVFFRVYDNYSIRLIAEVVEDCPASSFDQVGLQKEQAAGRKGRNQPAGGFVEWFCGGRFHLHCA